MAVGSAPAAFGPMVMSLVSQKNQLFHAGTGRHGVVSCSEPGPVSPGGSTPPARVMVAGAPSVAQLPVGHVAQIDTSWLAEPTATLAVVVRPPRVR